MGLSLRAWNIRLILGCISYEGRMCHYVEIAHKKLEIRDVGAYRNWRCQVGMHRKTMRQLGPWGSENWTELNEQRPGTKEGDSGGEIGGLGAEWGEYLMTEQRGARKRKKCALLVPADMFQSKGQSYPGFLGNSGRQYKHSLIIRLSGSVTFKLFYRNLL